MNPQLAADLPLLKPEDLGQMLNVSKRHIYSMAAKGQIPAIKLGKTLRFRHSSVLAWMQAQEKTNYGKAA
jgi:excisionase family DNA binding protein